MKNFVAVAGYDVQALPVGTMLDHFGVQLDVMAHLLGQISTGPIGAQDLDQVWEVANAFFAEHLLWAMDLLEAAVRRANTEFYRSSISLIFEFLSSEIRA